MLLFKLNQIDESVITDDVYFLSCMLSGTKKYITSVIGKNFTQVDSNTEILPDAILSTSLAYLYNPTLVCCTKDMLPIVTNALNISDVVYVNASVNIITSADQIQKDEEITDIDTFKLKFLQKANMLIKNYIPTVAFTSFMKCSLYIQKLIIENKVTMTFNTNTYSNKEQIVNYLATDTVSDELKTVVTEILENLPLDTLPSISDLDFETIEEDEINTLDSYLKDINKLTALIKMFYTFINAVLQATELEQLKELENKFIMNYYTQISLIA